MVDVPISTIPETQAPVTDATTLLRADDGGSVVTVQQVIGQAIINAELSTVTGDLILTTANGTVFDIPLGTAPPSTVGKFLLEGGSGALLLEGAGGYLVQES